MKKNATEIDLLKIFVKEMEEEGITKEQIFHNIDIELLAKINNVTKANISLEELQKITDKCIAREWLKHGSIGSRYEYILLTSSGYGVVRSLQIKEEAKAKRSRLKKLSDYIEDHKGLFTALGSIIAIAGFIIYRLKL